MFGSGPSSSLLNDQLRNTMGGFALAASIVGGVYAVMTFLVVGMGLLSVVSVMGMGGRGMAPVCCSMVVLMLEAGIFGGLAFYLFKGAGALRRATAAMDGDMEQAFLNQAFSSFRNFFMIQAALFVIGIVLVIGALVLSAGATSMMRGF